MSIDLEKFCGFGKVIHGTYDTECPFTVGDWNYASDGQICVRVPREGRALAVPKEYRPLPCEQLWTGGESATIPIPKLRRYDLPNSPYLAVRYGDQFIQADHDEAIRELPNVRYCPAKYSRTAVSTMPIYFEFDGGSGWVSTVPYDWMSGEPRELVEARNEKQGG